MGTLFSWIHLSDIHIGHGGASHEADQRLVLQALAEGVAAQIKDGLAKPDAIFVTGDIAFSGACVAADEYTRAEQWLDQIAKAAGLTREAIYVVPGNHDVQRSVDKPIPAKALLRSIRAGEEELDAALRDASTRKHLASRQANYLAFTRTFAEPCRSSDPDTAKLYWSHEIEGRDGLVVRVAGLNSALLAADESVFGTDQGALRIGNVQIHETLPRSPHEHEVVIVLSHHPFKEKWLADEKGVAAWARARADIHLSGHVHEAANLGTRSGGGGDFVHVSAGAVHGEKEPSGIPARHGYSFGEIIAEDVVKVRVWPRKWSDPNKRFKRDVDSADDVSGYATHPLPRVRLLPVATTNAKRGSTPKMADGNPSSFTTSRTESEKRTESSVSTADEVHLARVERELREFIAGRPRVTVSLLVQGLGDDATSIARSLLRKTSASDVASKLNRALAALEADSTATSDDRRAVRHLFDRCLAYAVDWQGVVEQKRSAVLAGQNAFDLPLRLGTLAEILLAGIDRRAPEFVMRDGLGLVGITQVEVPAILRSAVIPTHANFTEAMVKHLTAEVSDLQHLRDACAHMSPKEAAEYVDDALSALARDRPAEEVRPYFVAFGNSYEELWRVACGAQQAEGGLPSLRLVRLVGGNNWHESKIVRLVMDLVNRSATL